MSCPLNRAGSNDTTIFALVCEKKKSIIFIGALRSGVQVGNEAIPTLKLDPLVGILLSQMNTNDGLYLACSLFCFSINRHYLRTLELKDHFQHGVCSAWNSTVSKTLH